MKVNGQHYRSLWWNAESDVLEIIDQRWLPHQFRIQSVDTMQDFSDAIVEMRVRGAPLIGATAAYGIALAMKLDASDKYLDEASDFLNATRPTAINLRWAINRARSLLIPLPESQRAQKALALAHEIADEAKENTWAGQHTYALQCWMVSNG